MSEEATEVDDLIEYELDVVYDENYECYGEITERPEDYIEEEHLETHEYFETVDNTGEMLVEEELEEQEQEIVDVEPLDELIESGNVEEIVDDTAIGAQEEPLLEQVKVQGPKRFLLYDNLIAEVVDYDKNDGAPIVEFCMSKSEENEERLPVECGICPDVMHKSRLEAHLRTHLKPGTKGYMCIYCDENFISRSCAAGHARRHMGIRPYVCEPCKLYYCTKQDLCVHQERRHWAKDHKCDTCGQGFSRLRSLKNHIRKVHEEQRRFACPHCEKSFLQNYAMKEHVRNVHLGNRRPLLCPFCNLRFKDTHKLAQHRKEMHLNQENFECRVCGLEFTNIDFFDAHRRSLQCREKYKQEREQQRQGEGENDLLCDKDSRAKSSSGGARKRTLYECEKCGLKFKNSNLFEKHHPCAANVKVENHHEEQEQLHQLLEVDDSIGKKINEQGFLDVAN